MTRLVFPAHGRVTATRIGQVRELVLAVPEAVSTSCRGCRGRGWKFVGLRRSPSWAGDAGERAVLERARTVCLACLGKGSLPAEAPAREESD